MYIYIYIDIYIFSWWFSGDELMGWWSVEFIVGFKLNFMFYIYIYFYLNSNPILSVRKRDVSLRPQSFMIHDPLFVHDLVQTSNFFSEWLMICIIKHQIPINSYFFNVLGPFLVSFLLIACWSDRYLVVFLPRATVGLVSRAAAKGAKVPKGWWFFDRSLAFTNWSPLTQ